ncbi:MAG TPA: amidohydrolase family protein, partial [Pyrinomonadaceae bacterium]|nr:amidohydrolase family protein [Pyrinomonadaceae bacterium]
MKFLLLIFSFSLFCFPAFPQNKTADLVIINAKIRTMDRENPQAQAVAVSGNKISAVGTNKKIRSLIGAKTKIIDADKKLVLPGFNDSHVHFMGIGNQFFSIDLRDARTPHEAVEKIRFYVKFLPKGAWILGGGWNHDNWSPKELPTKELIDAATPEHPVFIYNLDPRMAWSNSLALRLAGIDKNKNEVQDGEIIRDKNGEPTGVLKDKAINLIKNVIPKLSTKNLEAVAET